MALRLMLMPQMDRHMVIKDIVADPNSNASGAVKAGFVYVEEYS